MKLISQIIFKLNIIFSSTRLYLYIDNFYTLLIFSFFFLYTLENVIRKKEIRNSIFIKKKFNNSIMHTF